MTAARACASRGGFFTQSHARVLLQVTRQGRESMNNMNETPANVPRSSDSSGPLDSITHGRLRFLSGASNVTVHADPSGGGLYRSRFEGVVPEVWTEGGVVNIWYPRFYSFGRRGCSGKVALNATIPWHIEVRGGASKVTADLSQLKLGSFGVAGGASKVELTLPRASGLVPVRVLGGREQHRHPPARGRCHAGPRRGRFHQPDLRRSALRCGRERGEPAEPELRRRPGAVRDHHHRRRQQRVDRQPTNVGWPTKEDRN